MRLLWKDLTIIMYFQITFSTLGMANFSSSQYIHDYSYLFVTESRPWNEALQICYDYGGRLARVNTVDVEDKFNQFFSKGGVWEGYPKHDYWIGLTVFEKSMISGQGMLTFFWSDCTEFDPRTTFLNVESDNFKKHYEYCIRRRSSDGKLKYGDCGNKRPFVCEVPYNDVCRYTEELSGSFHPGISITSCTEKCSQNNNCSGAVLIDDISCFLLFANASSSYVTHTSGKFSYLRKECEEAQLIIEIETVGLVNDQGQIPLVSCNAASLSLDGYSSSLSSDYSSSLYSYSGPFHGYSSSSVVGYSSISSYDSLIPSSQLSIEPSSTYEVVLSSSISPSSIVDLNDVTRIIINNVDIKNVTCTLEIVSVTSCLPANGGSISSTPVLRNDYCPTVASPTYYLVCNSSREKVPEKNLQEIIKNLTVKAENTAAYQNQFKSAQDPRPSSKAVGSVGAVFIAIPMVLVIIADLLRYYDFVKKVYKLLNGYQYNSHGNVYVEKVSTPKQPDMFPGAVPIYSAEVTAVPT